MNGPTEPAGRPVLVREMWRNQVWAARPMIMVSWTPVLVRLWMPVGTEWRAPAAGPGERDIADRGTRILKSLQAGGWGYLERRWRMNTLWLVPPGEPYAVWVCWDEDWRHLGWYVNFQAPLRRTGRTVSYLDWVLDLRIAPDRTVEVKDDDYLTAAVAMELISGPVADRIRSLAGTLGDQARDGAGLFAPDWIAWRPDPGWPAPDLPLWWADPEA